MGLTEAQQDGIVLEYTLMVAQQREVVGRHRAMLASLEQLQPALASVASNTNGVRPRARPHPSRCPCPWIWPCPCPGRVTSDLTVGNAAPQAYEAISTIHKEFQEKLLAYVRALSIDIIEPVQIGKMWVEASPFIMDPVKLGAYVSALTEALASAHECFDLFGLNARCEVRGCIVRL